jgi:hypothetical protein
VSILRDAVRRQCERAGQTTAAADDEENIMHVQYQFLAAMEYDQLRTASRRQGIEARRDHAARLTREQGFGTGRPRRSQTGGLKGGRPPFGKRSLTRAFGRRAFGRRTAGAAA